MALTQAARELGITRAVLWRHVKAGHIAAQQIGRFYVIAEAEVERFRLERRPPGRPRQSSP